MSENQYFKFSLELLLVPLFAVLGIWTVFWIELKAGINLNAYGVFPRHISGLKGVLFSPLIHGSVEHLYHNTFPLAILSLALFYFYRPKAWKVLLLGWVISGLLTWSIGRESYHIGASGIIYVLASFIFFKGVFQKHYRLVALSLAVVFIYGSMLWYIFPVEEGISWEGHLSGFVTGLLLARWVRLKVPVAKKYAWEMEDYNEEEDEFLQHFDDQGNFVERSARDKELPKINYEYKERDKR